MTKVSNSANILPKIKIAILLNYFVCYCMNYKTVIFCVVNFNDNMYKSKILGSNIELECEVVRCVVAVDLS